MRNDSQIVERDFAFLVGDKITAKELNLAARVAVQGSAVKLDSFSINVFDRFSGKGIEPGKKSIAFSLRMQPPSGETLETASIDKVSSAVTSQLVTTLGASQR